MGSTTNSLNEHHGGKGIKSGHAHFEERKYLLLPNNRVLFGVGQNCRNDARSHFGGEQEHEFTNSAVVKRALQWASLLEASK